MITEYQIELAEKLRSGELTYTDASIYTVLLSLVRDSSVGDVFTMLHNLASDLDEREEFEAMFEDAKLWQWKKFKNNEMEQDTGLSNNTSVNSIGFLYSKSDDIEPKEKAENLVVKFLKHSRAEIDITPIQSAKQCALIAVDELIKETGAKYWYNVKKEIEKL